MKMKKQCKIRERKKKKRRADKRRAIIKCYDLIVARFFDL